jgi:hypothetical protein
MDNRLSPIAEQLITEFDKKVIPDDSEKILVNPVVQEVATWYEKLRTAMDYREEEVILRASIERILKRRFLLGGSGKTIAEPLVRELVWARYFPEASVPAKIIDLVVERIDLYLELQTKVAKLHKIPTNTLTEWIYHLMSSDIEDVLSPSKDKELLSNFIYHLYKNKVIIEDDPDSRDAQVFIAVRRAFAREDLALLQYNLFVQYFGKLTPVSVDEIAENFKVGFDQFNKQLNYPLRGRILNYIKKQVPPFLITEKILRKHRGANLGIVLSPQQLVVEVIKTCTSEYQGIYNKVRRALIRSIIFIIVTKAIIALAIEGSYENLVYGAVSWPSIVFNTAVPPVIMMIIGSFIKVPGKENTEKILRRIQEVLYNDKPGLGTNLNLRLKGKKRDPFLEFMFALLWLLAFFLSFGGIVFILNFLKFNIISQAVFLFFLAIMSFLSYRIYQTAHLYAMAEEKQNLLSVFFDFLFMPFLQIGRGLTLGISQINIFLFLFDFLIETPFKGIFSFFEQWFLYLKSERENLD